MVRPVDAAPRAKPKKRFTERASGEESDDILDISSTSSSSVPSSPRKATPRQKTLPPDERPSPASRKRPFVSITLAPDDRPSPASRKRPSVPITSIPSQRPAPASRKTPPSVPSSSTKYPQRSHSPPKRPETRKYRPSVKVLQEIRRVQTSTDLLIPRKPFCRLVREITSAIAPGIDFRYSLGALLAIQEAAEQYLTGLMEDSYLLALHARRVTLMQRDLKLAYRIRGDTYRM